MSGEKKAGGEAAEGVTGAVKSETTEEEEWEAISAWFGSMGVEVQQLAALRALGMETWGHVRHLQKQHLIDVGVKEFAALMVMGAHEAMSQQPGRPRASTPIGRGWSICLAALA